MNLEIIISTHFLGGCTTHFFYVYRAYTCVSNSKHGDKRGA